MSQLIHIRQRMKAIETIKKITHAMRLISMSVHADLQHKLNPLNAYTCEIKRLFQKIILLNPEIPCHLLQPSTDTPERSLVILIGSQKGLCGSFNTGLLNIFKAKQSTHSLNTHYIIIGKKAVDFARSYLKDSTIISAYPTFSNGNRYTIAHNIAHAICSASPSYTHVSVYSNQSKTFFIQKPSITTVIPLLDSIDQTQHIKGSHDHIWEQAPSDIIQYLSTLYIQSSIEHILFQSLFSEHAARFVSMDMATRNAETLLETTKLKYNKLRQAKITKELTELVGSNL